MSEDPERPRLSGLDCAGAPTLSGSGPGLWERASSMMTATPAVAS